LEPVAASMLISVSLPWSAADRLRLPQSLRGQIDDHPGGREAIADAVEAGAAVDEIVAFVAAEDVRAGGARQRVIAFAAGEEGELVVGVLAVDLVVAVIAVEEVGLPAAAIDCIVAPCPRPPRRCAPDPCR
jgi:hypothetical protein